MPMKVAMLTSVEERCGIAAYTRALVSALSELVEVRVEPIMVGRQPMEHYQEQARRLNEADVIHIQHEHSFWGGILPNSSAFWNLRYLLEKPVVTTAHTTTALADLLRLKDEKRLLHRAAKQALVWRGGYRDSVETAPFVTGRCIVHTGAARAELIARGANPNYLHVLPAGVPVPAPAPHHGSAFREQHGLSGRKIVSLFGYIAPNKGYELTLRVLARLPKDVVLVIAGGVRAADLEPYGAEIGRKIEAAGLSNRVIITGYLPEEGVAEVMAASDVVIAPHTFATGSYSVMVPLAYGKAILASDLDCFREIDERGRCLELFRSGDEADYLEKLNSLLASKARLADLEQAAYAYAHEHSWREVARETVEIYGEAIEDVTRLAHHPVLPGAHQAHSATRGG